MGKMKIINILYPIGRYLSFLPIWGRGEDGWSVLVVLISEILTSASIHNHSSKTEKRITSWNPEKKFELHSYILLQMLAPSHPFHYLCPMPSRHHLHSGHHSGRYEDTPKRPWFKLLACKWRQWTLFRGDSPSLKGAKKLAIRNSYSNDPRKQNAASIQKAK